jgi:hypothetical protein
MSSAALFTGRFLELAGQDFTSDRLGQDFVRVDVGADQVAGLLSWPALNELLSTRALSAPRLRLFREGSQVQVRNYTRQDSSTGRESLIPDELYRELREGASLVLDSIDQLHPPIAHAADDLMRLVRELVQVNLYLVWGGGQGFDTHWDDHDTMIVQLAGSKHWTVHGPGRRYPMKVDNDHDHRPPDTVVWEGTLTAGDIVHVPRGWWHAVRGTGEMSMHLTFGFTRRTGIDWANWVLEQLYAEELFRQDLPRFANATAREQHSGELIGALAKIVAEHRPSDFLAARDRRFPRRPEINLPWPVRFELPADETMVEITSVLGLAIEQKADSVVLSAGGKTFRFAPVLGPLLRLLAQRRLVRLDELRAAAGLDEASLASALELLLHHHLVVLRDQAGS